MSELQRQIAEHRAKHVYTTSSANNGKQASLFLSLKEAAGVDIEVVHEAAVKNATILLQYEPRLAPYIDGGILHESSIGFQRDLKTAEENKILDKSIHSLLEILSAFASETSAHVILEYLIRRYNIHEYNVYALIKCFIHIHDSKIFAKILQLCAMHLTDATSSENMGSNNSGGGHKSSTASRVWRFLLEYARDATNANKTSTGVLTPPPRDMIVQKCRQDPILLQCIVDIVSSCKKLYCESSDISDMAFSGLSSRLAFFTFVLIEVIGDRTASGSKTFHLNDAQLRIIFPALFDCILSPEEGESPCSQTVGSWVSDAWNVECWKACIILLSQICNSSKGSLSSGFLNTLVSSLFKTIAFCVQQLSYISMHEDNVYDLDNYVNNDVLVLEERVLEAITLLNLIFVSQSVKIKPADMAQLVIIEDAEGSEEMQLLCIDKFVSLVKQYSISTNHSLQAFTYEVLLTQLRQWKAIQMESENMYGLALVDRTVASLIAKSLFSDKAIHFLLQFTFNLICIGSQDHEGFSDSRAFACRLLLQCSQKYPTVFNSATEKYISNVSLDTESRERFDSLLKDAFSNCWTRQPKQFGDGVAMELVDGAQFGNLHLALQNALPVIRIQAINEVVEKFDLNSGDKEDVRNILSCIVDLLVDRHVGVAAVVWDNMEALFCHIVAFHDLPDVEAIGFVSPSELFQAVRSAWDFWLNEVHSKGALCAPADAILLSIVNNTLCNSKFLDFVTSTTSTDVDAGNGVSVSASCWLFMSALRLYHGILPCELAGENRKTVDMELSLSQAASKLLSVLGGSGLGNSKKSNSKLSKAKTVYVDIVANSSPTNASSKSEILDYFAKSILGNIHENMSQEAFDVLHTSISCAHGYLNTVIGDDAMTAHHGWGYVHALILVLDAICEQCEDKNSLQFVVVCLLPLLLRLQGTPFEVTFDVHSLLRSCFDRCMGLFDIVPHEEELSVGGLNSNNIGYRVMIALLANSNGGDEGATELLSSAIQSFFMSDESSTVLVDVLVQIGVSQVVGHQLPATDGQLYVPQGCSGGVWTKVINYLTSESQYLLVPNDARAGGLVTFGAVVSSSSEEILPRLVEIVPLLLVCCSDSNSSVRSAATAAAALITQSAWFTAADKKVAIGNNSVSIAILQQILEAINSNADIIVNDGASISTLDIKGDGAVSLYLTESAVKFSWKACSLTSLLLEIVVNQFLENEQSHISNSNGDVLWSTMVLLLESYRPSVGSSELLNQMMGYIQILFTNCSNSRLQSTILEWVWGVIMTTAKAVTEVASGGSAVDIHSGVFNCVMKCILTSNTKLSCDWWCMGAKGAQLYISLVRIYLNGPTFNAMSTGRAAAVVVEPLIYDRGGIVSMMRHLQHVPELTVKFIYEEIIQPYVVTESTDNVNAMLNKYNAVLELFVECYVNVSDSSNKVSGLCQLLQRSKSSDVVAVFVRKMMVSLGYLINHKDSTLRVYSISVEYCISLILEIVDGILCTSESLDGVFKVSPHGEAAVTAATVETPKKGRGKGKTPVKGTSKPAPSLMKEDSGMAEESIDDIVTILTCIHQCNLSAIQSIGLKCMKNYMTHYCQAHSDASHSIEAMVKISISALSKLLASSTLASSSNFQESSSGTDKEMRLGWKDTLVSQILSTILEVSSFSSGTSSGMEILSANTGDASRYYNYNVLYDIIMGYTSHFGSMSQGQRTNYMHACMETLIKHNGSNANIEKQSHCQHQLDSILPSVVSVLLTNSYAASVSLSVEEKYSEEESSKAGFILLSRASSRAAMHSQMSSVSEDFFRLAVQVTTIHSLKSQLIRCGGDLHPANGVSLLSNAQLFNVAHTIANCVEFLKYVLKTGDNSRIKNLCESASHSIAVASNGSDIGASPDGAVSVLLLLHLEYVNEVLLSPGFHKYIAHLKMQEQREAAGSGDNAQQQQHVIFLQFFEHVLELYSLSNAMQLTGEHYIDVPNFDKESPATRRISKKSLVYTIRTWCLHIIKSLQKLLDIPSFIAILLELITVEDSILREHAIVILTDRLDYIMKVEDNGANMKKKLVVREAEKTLLLDLYKQLKTLISDGVAGITTAVRAPAKAGVKNTSSFTQSAIMCLDILTRYLGTSTTAAMAETGSDTSSATNSKWSKVFVATLAEFLPLLESITNTVTTSALETSNGTAVSTDEASLKIGGSMYLCIATLVSTVTNVNSDPRGRRNDSGSSSGGVKVLPYLSKIMSQMNSALTSCGKSCFEMFKSWQNHDAPSSDLVSQMKSEILLIRSLFSAYSNLFNSVSAYLHPYLHDVLLNVLSIFDHLSIVLAGPLRAKLSVGLMSDLEATLNDADYLAALSVMSVAPRLSLPIIMKNLSAVNALVPEKASADATVPVTYMSLGPYAVGLLVRTLTQLIRDKYHIAASTGMNMTVTNISVMLMDYRRLSLSDTPDTQMLYWIEDSNVYNDVCLCVIELCLKWTEGDLNNYISRLILWKDAYRPQDGESSNSSFETSKRARGLDGQASAVSQSSSMEPVNMAYCRSTVFYQLVAMLSAKLQSIFTSCLCTIVWPEMVTSIQHAIDLVQGPESSYDEAGSSTSGKKKRKAKKELNTDVEVLRLINAATASEISTQLQYVFTCVKGACSYAHDDNSNSLLFDQVRYESVMPLLISSLTMVPKMITLANPTWGLGSEHKSASLTYLEDFVFPSITSLAVVIKKDVLWKPMNHRLLIFTRPENSLLLRITAIKALHRLFEEVGEDYLLLLPECLPFLSELLEDESEEILLCTKLFIQHIETLSGEHLDSYLM